MLENIREGILEYYLCRRRMTERAVVASNPVVGSSRNSTAGDTIISMAMLVRFFCPPEIPRINWVPTWAIQSSHIVNSLHQCTLPFDWQHVSSLVLPWFHQPSLSARHGLCHLVVAAQLIMQCSPELLVYHSTCHPIIMYMHACTVCVKTFKRCKVCIFVNNLSFAKLKSVLEISWYT